MDRLNQIGVLESSLAFKRTVGWQLASAEGLDTFAKQLLERAGPHREQVDPMFQLCRRGNECIQSL